MLDVENIDRAIEYVLSKFPQVDKIGIASNTNGVYEINLDFLKQFPNITHFKLSCFLAKSADIQPIYYLKELQWLQWWSDNKVDISKFPKLNTLVCHYSDNIIFNNNNLSFLYLSYANKLSFLDKIPNLTRLVLRNYSGIDLSGIINRKIMESGTNNIAKQAAMEYDDAVKAIETGIEVVDEFARDGYNLFATGEMGIGNTTTSSAILKVLTDLSLDEIVGYGSGIDDKTLEHKKNVVKKAVEVNGLSKFFEENINGTEKKEKFEKNKIIDVLAKVGGLDIAGMVGTYLGCAKNRVPVVIDGFISAISALVAYKICPNCRNFMIASHLSEEPGMKYIMKELDLEPMLFMNMKLGEGTGAVVMFPVIEGACNITEVVRKYPDV